MGPLLIIMAELSTMVEPRSELSGLTAPLFSQVCTPKRTILQRMLSLAFSEDECSCQVASHNWRLISYRQLSLPWLLVLTQLGKGIFDLLEMFING